MGASPVPVTNGVIGSGNGTWRRICLANLYYALPLLKPVPVLKRLETLLINSFTLSSSPVLLAVVVVPFIGLSSVKLVVSVDIPSIGNSQIILVKTFSIPSESFIVISN